MLCVTLKDEKLASALADAVERLDPKLSQEALNKLPKKDGVINLPTPFANFFERKSEFVYMNYFELFVPICAATMNNNLKNAL